MAISSFISFALSAVTASAGEVNRQFTLAPGGAVCFTYPEAGSNAPVHIMVSESLGNGAMLVPTSLVSAVVNRDRRRVSLPGSGRTATARAMLHRRASVPSSRTAAANESLN
jgi:hypothetical protein